MRVSTLFAILAAMTAVHSAPMPQASSPLSTVPVSAGGITVTAADAIATGLTQKLAAPANSNTTITPDDTTATPDEDESDTIEPDSDDNTMSILPVSGTASLSGTGSGEGEGEATGAGQTGGGVRPTSGSGGSGSGAESGGKGEGDATGASGTGLSGGQLVKPTSASGSGGSGKSEEGSKGEGGLQGDREGGFWSFFGHHKSGGSGTKLVAEGTGTAALGQAGGTRPTGGLGALGSVLASAEMTKAPGATGALPTGGAVPTAGVTGSGTTGPTEEEGEGEDDLEYDTST